MVVVVVVVVVDVIQFRFLLDIRLVNLAAQEKLKELYCTRSIFAKCWRNVQPYWYSLLMF